MSLKYINREETGSVMPRKGLSIPSGTFQHEGGRRKTEAQQVRGVAVRVPITLKPLERAILECAVSRDAAFYGYQIFPELQRSLPERGPLVASGTVYKALKRLET